MFGLTPEDYAREHGKNFGSNRRKDQRVTSIKVKFPTQHKTSNNKKQKKCSLCFNDSVQRIQISDKEFRELCQIHLADWNRRNLRYSVKFEKAGY
ncbi:hypothetical protein [Nitrososphaeria virus YSH_1032793]|uniref:Uncharacterized protein n=1 Tax=Nitrososphaeria virus YSH_1032793 TaxID=3071320 RepID=A0A976UB74_9CAUD|nr:hypothetical protein QKV91_gp06 [Yangshan Harbor Nitrososphaeria virus]UVF62210.1 hypothetical protein [Nitrososphaeria virus YSH_1032793]